MEKKNNFNLETITGKSEEKTGHFGVKYRGIRYVKCPFDYVIYQMILEEIKPDLVVEIGTFQGGGALYIADIISKWGGIVHTIDIVNCVEDEIVEEHPNIFLFRNGYQGYDTSLAKEFKRVLVIDDGSHYSYDVKEAFEKFNHLVCQGSYYIIEDGSIYFTDPSSLEGGPVKAIEEILSENSKFQIDRKWCDFFGLNATFNTDGYLRRM